MDSEATVIKYIRKNNIWMIQVIGEITEKFGHERPAPEVGIVQVEIFFSDVRVIKSVGIRNWISWITWLSVNNKKIVLHDCPKVVIDLFNLIDSSLPANCRVDSFYVPFINDETLEEKNILLKRNQNFDESGKVEIPVVEDTVGQRMTADINPGRYFQFLAPKAMKQH